MSTDFITQRAIKHFMGDNDSFAWLDVSKESAKREFLRSLRENEFYASADDVNAIGVLAEDEKVLARSEFEAAIQQDSETLKQIVTSGLSSRVTSVLESLKAIQASGATPGIRNRAALVIYIISNCDRHLLNFTEVERAIIEAFCILAAASPGDKRFVRQEQLEKIHATQCNVSIAFKILSESCGHISKVDQTLSRQLQEQPGHVPAFNTYQSVIRTPKQEPVYIENSSPNRTYKYYKKEKEFNGWWLLAVLGFVVSFIVRFAARDSQSDHRYEYEPPPNIDAITNEQIRQYILDQASKDDEYMKDYYTDEEEDQNNSVSRDLERILKTQQEVNEFNKRMKEREGERFKSSWDKDDVP